MEIDKNFNNIIVVNNSMNQSIGPVSILINCKNTEWLKSNYEIKSSNSEIMWEKLFNFFYEKSPNSEDFLDSTNVWISSYNQKPIPKVEMDEWLDLICNKIQAYLSKSSNVLEVGCGNGLIYKRIINHIKSYTGIDTSAVSIQKLNDLVDANANTSSQFYKASANELDKLPPSKYDLVIINSVAQYFPGLDYLLRFITSLENYLAPNSVIIFGDIISYPHRGMFYQKVLKGKNQEINSDVLSKLHLQERETLYHPYLFQSLSKIFPFIYRAQVDLKRGHYENEMNDFRYDVILECKPNDDSNNYNKSSSILDNISNPRLSDNKEAIADINRPFEINNSKWIDWDIENGLDKIKLTSSGNSTSDTSSLFLDQYCNKISEFQLTGENASKLSNSLLASYKFDETPNTPKLLLASNELIHFCEVLQIKSIQLEGTANE